jgi:hypothetical protein
MAYGNPNVTAPDFGFDSLLGTLPKEGNEVKVIPATLSTTEKTNPVKVVKAPEPEFPWKKYALWASLVAALLLSSLMAWKLYSELNQTKK